MKQQFFTTTIQHGSDAYRQMIQLRNEVLLQPIGIDAAYIKPELEKKDLLLGAFEESHLIGCCVLTPKDNHTVQLRQMAVQKSMQGKGVGVAILSYAEATAKSVGFQTLVLHARSNVVSFYQKSGYVVTGHPFEEVGIEHYKMEKTL